MECAELPKFNLSLMACTILLKTIECAIIIEMTLKP